MKTRWFRACVCIGCNELLSNAQKKGSAIKRYSDNLRSSRTGCAVARAGMVVWRVLS